MDENIKIVFNEQNHRTPFSSSSSTEEEGEEEEEEKKKKKRKKREEENKMNSVESLAISALQTATRSSSLNNNNMNNIKNNNNGNNNNVVKLNKTRALFNAVEDSFQNKQFIDEKPPVLVREGEYTSQNTPPWRNLRSYSPLRLGFSSPLCVYTLVCVRAAGVQRITLIFS